MWHCFDCNSDFEHFKVLHDSVQIGEDEYDDKYVCPVCGSEDFANIETDNGV